MNPLYAIIFIHFGIISVKSLVIDGIVLCNLDYAKITTSIEATLI